MIKASKFKKKEKKLQELKSITLKLIYYRKPEQCTDDAYSTAREIMANNVKEYKPAHDLITNGYKLLDIRQINGNWVDREPHELHLIQTLIFIKE